MPGGELPSLNPPGLDTCAAFSTFSPLRLGGGVKPGKHPCLAALTTRSASAQPLDGEAVLGPPPSQSHRLGPRRGACRGEEGGATRPHLCGESLLAPLCAPICTPLTSLSTPGSAPRAPLCIRCSSTLRPAPRSAPAAEPAPPAPTPHGAGRGCGAGGTSDSALLARRLHGAQCQRAQPAGDAARAPVRARARGRLLTAPPPPPPPAAAAAETMDAGAAPRKHSRCRAAPGAAPGLGGRAGAPLLGAGRVGADAERGRPAACAARRSGGASGLRGPDPGGRAGMLEGAGGGVGAGSRPGLSWRPQVRAEASGATP